MDEKLAKAKAFLGTSWVLHPEYDPAEYPHHRTRTASILRAVRADAVIRNRI